MLVEIKERRKFLEIRCCDECPFFEKHNDGTYCFENGEKT